MQCVLFWGSICFTQSSTPDTEHGAWRSVRLVKRVTTGTEAEAQGRQCNPRGQEASGQADSSTPWSRVWGTALPRSRRAEQEAAGAPEGWCRVRNGGLGPSVAFGPGATGHTGNVTECPTEPRKWLRMPGAVPGDVEVSFRCKLSINSRQRQSPTFELSRPVCCRPLTCQQGSPQHARGATALREEAGAAAEPRGPPDAAPRGLRYMLTGPPAGGATSPTLGAGGV